VLLKRLLILGLLVLGIPAFTQAAVLPSKYKSMVLVNITAMFCTPEEAKEGCKEGGVVGHGSGVIVSSDTVVTAKHVASHVDKRFIVVDQDGVEHEVISVSLSPTQDFATLKVKEPFKIRPAKISCKEVQPLEKLYIVGYPMDFDAMIFVVLASGYYQDGDDGRVLLAEGTSLPGNSGGPVYNTKGELVGLLTGEYLYEADGSMVDTDLNTISPMTENMCGKEEAQSV
jgi:hypothetical protein